MEQKGQKLFCLEGLVVLALVLSLFVCAPAGAESWKFGVMSDMQWTAPTDPAGKNPNGVAVSIIDQINRKFIDAGVRCGLKREKGNDLLPVR